MGGDLEEQGDELLALSTILETAAFSYSPEPPHRGSLEVEVRLDSPLTVVTPDRGDFQVRHLPPLRMEFSLPPDYPSLCPPLFLLTCPWLLPAQKAGVEARLEQLWQENRGGVILFLWLNFLQEEVMDFLELSSSLDLRQFEAVLPEEPHTEPGAGLENLRIGEDSCQDSQGRNLLHPMIGRGRTPLPPRTRPTVAWRLAVSRAWSSRGRWGRAWSSRGRWGSPLVQELGKVLLQVQHLLGVGDQVRVRWSVALSE
jgi:hypothetical protein